MRRRSIVLAAFVATVVMALVAAGPRTASAQAIDPALEADILALLDNTNAAAMTEQVAVAVFNELSKSFRAARPDLPARATEILSQVTREMFASTVRGPQGMIARTVPIYVKYFTHDDIRAMLAFYRTETGRKTVRVMPQLIQDSMQAGQQWAEWLLPQIEAEVQKRLEAEGLIKK